VKRAARRGRRFAAGPSRPAPATFHNDRRNRASRLDRRQIPTARSRTFRGHVAAAGHRARRQPGISVGKAHPCSARPHCAGEPARKKSAGDRGGVRFAIAESIAMSAATATRSSGRRRPANGAHVGDVRSFVSIHGGHQSESGSITTATYRAKVTAGRAVALGPHQHPLRCVPLLQSFRRLLPMALACVPGLAIEAEDLGGVGCDCHGGLEGRACTCRRSPPRA